MRPGSGPNEIIVAGLEALPVGIPVLTEEAVEAFTGAEQQARPKGYRSADFNHNNPGTGYP